MIEVDPDAAFRQSDAIAFDLLQRAVPRRVDVPSSAGSPAA